MKHILNFPRGLWLAALIVLPALSNAQIIVNEPVESSTAETSEKFAQLLSHIGSSYVDEVDQAKLVEEAIVQMLKKLDPHSIYISKEDLEEMNEPLVGNFDGIGIRFNIHKDTILVVSPISGGPSEKLGIRAGDKIIEIEGASVAGVGIKNKDVMEKLRGDRGTKVKVSIARSGVKNLLTFNITRDKIPIYSVDASYMVTPSVGYIKVNRFSATTMTELREGLTDLKSKGMEHLILDLQGNGGGYLKTAIDMSDEFLDENKLIVYTEGKAFPRNNTHAKNPGMFEKGKLVVLIDEGSASASEIVSGAVQDWDRGLVIGRRSFGKGLVQRPVNLPDSSAVRLTISRYYTPSGRCIQKPYDEGVDEYRKEKSTRFANGELSTTDSISFPDSLKFYTNGKRIVYGGGGIMPDVFVPLDTNFQSQYYSRLWNKGVYNSFIYEYLDRNRQALMNDYPDFQSFKKNFEVDQSLVDELVAFGEKEEVPFDKEGYEKSKEHIHARLRAQIAQNLWDTSAFYEIMNTMSPAYQKAILVLQDGTYEKMNLAMF